MWTDNGLIVIEERREDRPAGPRTLTSRPGRMRWLLAVGLCIVLAGEAGGQGSPETDRAALAALYRATGGDDWTDNTKWLSAAPLGDWFGVEADEDGRVTGLRLGGWVETARDFIGNGLTGSLPPELGTLSRLRWLEIGGNTGLTSPIPAQLGDLTNLESLILQANRLVGSIPAELGRLTSLRDLALGTNVALSGQVPPELGNLVDLRALDLRYTMLSGPLPEGLTRLSAMDWLPLEGSGLCVPDTPVARAWLATISEFTGAVCEDSLTFQSAVTQLELRGPDTVWAVADLDGDGRDDILAGEHLEFIVASPDERLTKASGQVLLGERNGSFRHAPELVVGTIEARWPVVVTDDFNGDGRADLAVFDAGVYVVGRGGFGNPPQLFLSGADGRVRPSDALADAVRREHELRPRPYYSGSADLHLKSATSGDIDGDGDVDLWVESTGGHNVESHFMVNNGDGTFTLDVVRAPYELLHNPPPEFWRHVGNALVDLDNDGDLDLALGQIRDLDPTHVNQFSIVLVNDGSGHYPARIELPQPAFADAYTSVQSLTHFDVNGDGFQDLLLPHSRNDGVPDVIPWTGRYVQVLVNRGGASFDDETSVRMGDQSATTPERDANGDPLYNIGVPSMHDVDRDGCADLVVTREPARTDAPLVYRNDGSGRFQAMSPVPFVGSRNERDQFGFKAVPADVNGDGTIDFVVPYPDVGLDGRYGTVDDDTMFVTLLNTTPAGPIRCADPANRPPAPAGTTLPNRTLAPDGTVTVDVSRAFVDPDGDALTYTVSSSVPRVVAASAAGARVMLTAVGEGTATIRVTATDPGGLSATQSFTVTVSTTVSGSFTDDPLQPGVTPVRAVHFTELRTRIDALRSSAGLPRFSWTDPVLRAGVTPVRRVHLLELRSALAEAYSALGRSAPRWTDASPVSGTTPIRAMHVTELRAAVLALE